MLIILSPAKTMKEEVLHNPLSIPFFHKKTMEMLPFLSALQTEEIMKLMKINKTVALKNRERFQHIKFDLNGICAMDAYDGLQYKSMHLHTLQDEDWHHAQKHIRILSGLYGVLRPFDSIYPYRLEMQTRLDVHSTTNLYTYWANRLANYLWEELQSQKERYIINLSSKEYEKAVRPYIPKENFIDIVFLVKKDGILKNASTQAKMMRGEMVHWICKKHIESVDQLKLFEVNGYQFSKEQSNPTKFVFIRRQAKNRNL